MEVIVAEKPVQRLRHYVCLCFAFFSFAFYMSILGPTIEDLSQQLNCPVQEISYGLSLRTIVNCLAGVFCTFTIHIFNRQLQLIVHLIIYAICSAVLPFLHHIYLFYLQSIVSGISNANINAIIVQWTIELYANEPKKLKYNLQIVFLMFPIASFISILTTSPFLSSERSNNSTSGGNQIKNDSRIDIPFFISSVLSIIPAIVFLYFYFQRPYKPVERTLDGKDKTRFDLDEKKNPVPKWYYILVTALFLGCIAFQLGQESNIMYYTHTFLLKSNLNLTKSSAGYVTSIIYFTYGVGRFINIFVSIKISTKQMIYSNLALMLLANLLILFLLEKNIWICYIAFAILGFSFSSMLPLLINFFEERANMTMRVSSLMVASGTTIATLNHMIVGKTIEIDYNIFRIMSFVYTIILIFIFIIINLTDLIKRRLIKKSSLNG